MKRGAAPARPPKPGRPRLPEDQKRSMNFTFRGTAALHEKLRLAALADQRTVSETISARLEASFDPDRDTEKAFASQGLFSLVRLLGTAMQIAGERAAFMKNKDLDRARNWIDEPYAFDQAAHAAWEILDELRPPGDKGAPQNEDRALSDFLKTLGPAMARPLIAEMAAGTPRGERLIAGLPDTMTSRIRERSKK